MGIEPTFEAWEAPVLPLNYTRVQAFIRPSDYPVKRQLAESDNVSRTRKKNGHRIGGRCWYCTDVLVSAAFSARHTHQAQQAGTKQPDGGGYGNRDQEQLLLSINRAVDNDMELN